MEGLVEAIDEVDHLVTIIGPTDGNVIAVARYEGGRFPANVGDPINFDLVDGNPPTIRNVIT